MSKKITALEISKNLPMTVKCLNEEGMFSNQEIRFHELSHKSGRPRLLGEVVAIKGRVMCVLELSKEFEVIEQSKRMKMKVTIRLKSVGQLMLEGYNFGYGGELTKCDIDGTSTISPDHLQLLGEKLECEESHEDRYRYCHENSKTNWHRSQVDEVFQVLPTEPKRYNIVRDLNVYLNDVGDIYFVLKDSRADKIHEEAEGFTKIELE